MHTKNLENSSKIESFMGQNAQAHKLNLMSVYIYIQSWPKRLTHYDFWKIIAFGSKNEFKMGDQCYHILEEVPLNISRGVPNHWPNSALWSIHIISTQNRGVKTPLFNFVCDFLESWPSHTCFDYS